MISTTTISLLIIFLLANSGVLAYFVNKYRETQLRTTMYWVVSYGFFVLALLVSLVLAFGDSDLNEVVNIQIPFVLIGLTGLTMSALSTGFLSENPLSFEVVVGLTGIIGFLMYFFGFDQVTSIIFVIMSLTTVIAYFYLAYTGRNPRIAIISFGLLLQGVSGRLSAGGTISTNYQLFFNSIGQIAIAIGLLGIGLKNTQVE